LDEHDRKGERSDVIISWTLTALSKLTIRLKNCLDRVKEIVSAYTDHANVEIQQRACEYLEIFKEQWNEERSQIFEPILFRGHENMLVDQTQRAVQDDDDAVNEPVAQAKPAANDLDMFGGSSEPQTAAATPAMIDLDDMLGGVSSTPAATQG